MEEFRNPKESICAAIDCAIVGGSCGDCKGCKESALRPPKERSADFGKTDYEQKSVFPKSEIADSGGEAPRNPQKENNGKLSQSADEYNQGKLQLTVRIPTWMHPLLRIGANRFSVSQSEYIRHVLYVGLRLLSHIETSQSSNGVRIPEPRHVRWEHIEDVIKQYSESTKELSKKMKNSKQHNKLYTLLVAKRRLSVGEYIMPDDVGTIRMNRNQIESILISKPDGWADVLSDDNTQ